MNKGEDSNEAELEKEKIFTQQSRIFIDYINHDWEEDKAWQAFMNANPEIMAD